jgi:hypothetical protein
MQLRLPVLKVDAMGGPGPNIQSQFNTESVSTYSRDKRGNLAKHNKHELRTRKISF